MLISDCVKKFLELNTHSDLASLYSKNIEMQLIVSKDQGNKVEGDFKGKGLDSFTDGLTTWYPIRIPKNANKDPEDNDREATFDIAAHTLGIGLTGWNWLHKKSKWVFFDFDSLIGHSNRHVKKLTDIELKEIEKAVVQVPWVTLRKSTSGNGLHIYIFLEDVPTNTHTEHAALARYILGMLSAQTGCDLQSRVDAMGGIGWLYHRKMIGTDGLSLIKQGEKLTNISSDWKNHIAVITGRKRRVIPQAIENSNIPEEEKLFLELTSQRNRIEFDDEHKKLISYLQDSGHACDYNQDLHLITTHTYALKQAHKDLKLKGIFETLAEGSQKGDWNCFNGETEILTRQGVKKFKECVNTEQELYVYDFFNREMRWIRAPIKSFGIQTTYSLKFGNNYVVRTTADHQWLTRLHYNEKELQLHNSLTTKQLIFEKTLLPLAPVKLPEQNDDYLKGYAHGFVFGDGWIENCRGKVTCTVALFKNDNDLTKLLCRYGNYGESKFKNHGYVTCIRQLPNHWKQLPECVSKSYALGFILGFVSADGFVGTNVQIFQSNYEVLEETRKIAIFAGLRAGKIRYHTCGSFPNSKQSYVLPINSYNLTSEHFLRRDHKKLLSPRKKCFNTTVTYVDWTNPIEEEVFCAVVPINHNFTLASGVITRNCFGFPNKNGSWAVKRFTPGIAEAPSWGQDANGYTSCSFNVIPDLRTACKIYGGLEDTKKGFVFLTAEKAQEAANLLGVDLKLPVWALGKETILRKHEDGRLLAKLKYDNKEDLLKGGILGYHIESKHWTKLFSARLEEPGEIETINFDNMIRHLLTPTGKDAGWTIKVNTFFQDEPISHVGKVLKSMGYKSAEVEVILGKCIVRAWRLVNIPFQPEYLQDRQWNRNAAQLRFLPLENKDNLHYPTWLRLLNHIGKNLDNALKTNKWAIENNVLTGADYLKIWIASLFQFPGEKLPYLFLYGVEFGGKTAFHEAISLLVTDGVKRADTAILSQGDFTSELENAILCVIEDKSNLKQNKNAFNKIKDWVTSSTITIHKKGIDPYDIPNTCHFTQTSNYRDACPIFSGDTRVTAIQVDELTVEDRSNIKQFWQSLEKEAPDFITSVLSLEIPKSNDRLNVPIIVTDEKLQIQESNLSELERFIKDVMYVREGEMVRFSDFYERFIEYLDPNDQHNYSKIRVSRELSTNFPVGKLRRDLDARYIGNLSFSPPDENNGNGAKKSKLIIKNEHLVSSI